ncbi:MAG: hypothetical protein FGM32_08435 [Candidatus Kapabacteria bacterium]|nr:hypothetical protein [Candidatus Kapabacteria bacterium]
MRVLAPLCALICASFTIVAQQRISTPPQPVRIVALGDTVHLLCARTDVNFNGNFDDGDATAYWKIVDAASRQVIRETGFGWGSVLVQRFGISEERGVFDIGFNDEVYRYSMATQTNTDIVLAGSFSSVSTSADGQTVWVAQRPNFTDPGTIAEVDVKSRAGKAFPAGINPQAPLPYSTANGNGLAAICEGTFGGGNGTLELWTDLQGARKRTTIPVGDTPNHLLINGDRAYVTVNGSHHVVVVDLAKQTAIDTFLVGTSGYDGPRECAIDTAGGAARLYVTTFSSDVRVFDVATGNRIATLAVGAKPEGLAIVGRELWVTRTFVEGGYAAASDVVIFDLNALTSVHENTGAKAPSGYLAVGGSLRLPFELRDDATLTDLAGKTTWVSAVVSDAQTLDCRHLPSGVYALRSGQHSVTVIR